MNKNRCYLQTKFSVKMKLEIRKNSQKLSWGAIFLGTNFWGAYFRLVFSPGAFFLEPGKAIE